MKTRILVSLLTVLLFFCAGDAGAQDSKSFSYDVSMRMTFGLGYGKQAVRDEAFAEFVEEVMCPAFTEGFTIIGRAWGRWEHPDRGPIQERNVVVFLDFVDTPENRAAVEKVAHAFVDRFPGSNASVYVVATHGIKASIVYQ